MALRCRSVALGPPADLAAALGPFDAHIGLVAELVEHRPLLDSGGEGVAVPLAELDRQEAHLVGLVDEILDLANSDETRARMWIRVLQPYARHLVFIYAEYMGDRPLAHLGGRDAVFTSRRNSS